MRPSVYKKPKKIKLFLLAIIIITLGGVIWISIGLRPDTKTAQEVLTSIPQDATMSIGKIHQTATRKGRKEWSLEASSAHYWAEASQLVLKEPSVTFFLKDNSEVTVTADQGILQTDSNDIEVSGNVVLRNNQYELITDHLNYAHDRRVLYSNAPVTVSGDTAELTADSISFDLDSKKLTLEGGVEATLAEKFTL